MYGLPMASANFRDHSDNTFENICLLPTISDPSTYVKFYDNDDKAFISVHANDLSIAASNMKIINSTKIELSKYAN